MDDLENVRYRRRPMYAYPKFMEWTVVADEENEDEDAVGTPPED